MPPPTASEIADALAGRNGPVNLRYRFQQRDTDFNFIADLSAAVTDGSIEVNNDRAVVRTATFSIIPERMPAAFNASRDNLAVIGLLLVPTYQGGSSWLTQEVEIPAGLFRIDAPEQSYRPNSNDQWVVQASDMTVNLLTAKFTTPYTVASGTNYITAVEAIINLLGLRHSFAAVADTTPVSLTWAPGMTYWQAITDLLFGINWYAPWADATGVFTSRERIDPATETAAVIYDTTAEPRMVTPPFTKSPNTSRYANRIAVVIDDPRRTADYALRVNNDPDSPISVVSLSSGGYPVVNSDPSLSGGRVVNIATAQEIADFELKDRSCRSEGGSIKTFGDPRRGPHESYQLTVGSVVSGELWRALGWKLALAADAVMDHSIDFARAITTSIVITLTGTITTATKAQIVAGGRTIILTMPTGYSWVAAGATFDATRAAILAGLVSSGVEANGWNVRVSPALVVGNVVRTSATVVTITLPAVALYNITVPETVTATVPVAAVLTGLDNYTEPSFTIIP